jgi:hypothetical protein
MGETATKSRDYFAELYVAGVMGDAGWSVYFPKRDVGFDFIISKSTASGVILRPVQVKGKYPSDQRSETSVYGYVGKLTLSHPEMVLAIPFFPQDRSVGSPSCIAYLPRWHVKQHSRGVRCQPATFKKGIAAPRREFRHLFGVRGLAALELATWALDPKGKRVGARAAAEP